MIKSRRRISSRTAKPSAKLKARYLKASKSEKELEVQIKKLENMKAKYAKDIDGLFGELQKSPAEYKYKVRRGKKIVEKSLTAAEVRRHRTAFKKNVARADLAKFLSVRNRRICPPRSGCVRINRTPAIFNTCCYLCASIAFIQCYGDFP